MFSVQYIRGYQMLHLQSIILYVYMVHLFNGKSVVLITDAFLLGGMSILVASPAINLFPDIIYSMMKSGVTKIIVDRIAIEIVTVVIENMIYLSYALCLH